MNSDLDLQQLEEKLTTLDVERAKLILEINNLRNAERADTLTRPLPPLRGQPSLSQSPVSPTEKVNLFLKLFRCRENVFPKRWENPKSGKKGYSPACANEWVKPICQKPAIRCSDCHHQKFFQLNEAAIENHLKGTVTVGTYAIREDDSCVFLACDFDESTWKEDVLAFKQAARELGIEVAVERSRSGNGAHAWIFFEDRVPARIARSLGTLILAKCSELNVRLSLDSYDRFFPSQDYLPNGGFGNLIALPLQKGPRENGNSCFLDDDLNPIRDQWTFLGQVRCISLQEVRATLDQCLSKVDSTARRDAFDDVSWIIDKTIIEKTTSDQIEYSLDGETVEIVFGPMIIVPLKGLPGRVVAKLKKTSSFPNPEFVKSSE